MTNAFLADTLHKLQDAQLYRSEHIVPKHLLNFSSNNYLGLAQHPRVIQASQKALQAYGAGTTSSRLISGTWEIHHQLEAALASFKKTESSVVFPTGYMANVGTISALVGPGDAILADRLNHASLWDGCKLSGARLFVYEHRDAQSLERLLQRTKNYSKRLLVTDSLFSMDGDMAPLPEIVELAQKYEALVMIDEAHATGVFGGQGAGLAEHFHLEGKIDIVMGTLSKSLGSLGGYVCGRQDLTSYLKNKARSYIYTTALPPSCCGAALEALAIVKQEPERRRKVLALGKSLRRTLQQLGFDTLASSSQIVPIRLGSAARALEAARVLEEEGIFAPAIRPPTVPDDQCRIRFSLTADHTQDHLKTLESALMAISHYESRTTNHESRSL